MQYTNEELENILDLHKKWLYKKDGKRANLSGANLRLADLGGCSWVLSTDLRSANLHGANLHCANLSHARLSGANLHDANLKHTTLSDASLHDANLRNACLHAANLSGASLRGANLRGVDLSRANLSGTNFLDSNLHNAKNAEIIQAETIICPEGELIGWKKVLISGSDKDCLVKLRIPKDAKRSNAAGRKCRASKAEVLSIQTFKGEVLPLDTVVTEYNKSGIDYEYFTKVKSAIADVATGYNESGIDYVYGKTVYPDSFDEDRWDECSNGIHFFITREEAIAWRL